MQNALLILITASLLAACGEQKSGGQADKNVTAPRVNKTYPPAPMVKAIQEYKFFFPDDTVGFLLRKETFNDKGLKTEAIEFDYNTGKRQTDRTTYEYDGKGSLVKLSNNSGKSTFTYNNKGLKATETLVKSNGRTFKTEYFYDDKDQLVEMKWYENGKFTHGKAWEHRYDAKDSIIAIGWRKAEFQPHTTLKYDDEGRLIEKHLFNDDGREHKSYAYRYDEAGNLTEQTEFDEGRLFKKEISEYNEYGRCTKSQTVGSDGKMEHETTYRYDKYGNRIYELYVEARALDDDGNIRGADGRRMVYQYAE
jgi:YD repeat-containing protein